MGERTVESYLFYTGFCVLYLGQALWAHAAGRERWIGRALVFVNQWVGVLEASALCGLVAVLLELFVLSGGRIVTGVAGIGWSGPPSHEAAFFAGGFFLAFAASAFLLVRAPAGSAVAKAALFFGPGAAMTVAVFLWGLLAIGALTR